MISKSWYKSSK